MSARTWWTVGLLALVALGLVWWLRKKSTASSTTPTGVTSVGPITVTDWNPPPAEPKAGVLPVDYAGDPRTTSGQLGVGIPAGFAAGGMLYL